MPQLCEECLERESQDSKLPETPLTGAPLSNEEETETTIQPGSKPTTSFSSIIPSKSETMIMPAPFLTTDPALATDPIQIAAEQEARIWGLARLQAVLDRLQAETPTPKQIPLPQDDEEESVVDTSVAATQEDKEEKKRLKKQKQKEKKKEKAEKDKKDLEDYIEKNRDRKGKQREEQGQEHEQDTNTGRQESEIEEHDTPRPIPLDLPLDADFESPANYQGPFDSTPVDPNATPAIPTGSFQSDFTTPKGFTPTFLLGETPSPYPSEISQSPYFPASHSEEEDDY